MPDAILSRRIRKYDEQRTSPEKLDRTNRASTTRHICMKCRASSASTKNDHEIFLSPDTDCPNCGGKVIRVTW